MEQDSRRGVRTLPMALGQNRAMRVVKALMGAFYGSVLALAIAFSPWVLLTLLSLPRLRRVWKVFSEPRPERQPENWPIWPRWYAPWAFWLTRRAGELFVLGLVLELALRWKLAFRRPLRNGNSRGLTWCRSYVMNTAKICRHEGELVNAFT